MPDPSASPAEDCPKLLVSLATYNEAGNLQPLVETIRQFAPTCSILVIDDNSPDGTGRIADELRDTLPNIHVIHRPGKLGLGTATLAAMRFAIDHHFDYLLNLDADFSHPPRFIPDLLAGHGRPRRDDRLALRARRRGRGRVHLKRRLMSSGINGYARLMLGLTSQRQQRRVPVLSRQQAGRDRPRPGPVARLLVPGRDPLLVPDGRLPDRRDADPVRKPPRRQRRRSTCARPSRPSGSCSSSASLARWAASRSGFSLTILIINSRQPWAASRSGFSLPDLINSRQPFRPRDS